MIRSIQITGFRNHRDTQLEGLGPLVAIVGPNASGKTNLLRAVALAGQFAKVGKVPERFPRGAEIVVRTDEGAFGVIADSVPAGLRPSHRLVPDRHLSLDGEQIGAVSIMRETPPTMSSQGWGLASCIRYMQTTNRPLVDELFALASRVIPGLAGGPAPQVRPVKQREAATGFAVSEILEHGYGRARNDNVAAVAVNDTVTADELWLNGRPADQASEGTLICLALLTEMVMTDNGTVLVDDIDHGLHPGAQRELIDVLRKLVETRPDSQIILTTHSPYVIDQLRPEEVWVFNRDSDGFCVAQRLSEHPDAERALDVLTTGEFWSAEGEQWVNGAASASHE